MGTSQGKNSALRKNEPVARAKARVVTARNRPRMRRAGRPMSTAMPAPTRPATARQKKMFLPCWAMVPATEAPKAAKASWPRLIWPAQPVRISSDRMIMPKMSPTPNRLSRPGLVIHGASTRKRATAPSSPRTLHLTEGRRISSRGMGRTSLVEVQLEAPTSSALDPLPRLCSSSARRMMKKRTASTMIVRPVSNSTACSTAAARARSRRLGPRTAPMETPWMGRRRSTPRPDMPAAMTQTSVWMRLTGTPSRAALSADSAEARTAMPTLV